MLPRAFVPRHQLGIDAPLLYFGDDGRKVMRFIRDPQPMDEAVMRRPENLLQAARIFRRLHTCGEDTGVRFLYSFECLVGEAGWLPESSQNGDGLHLTGEAFTSVMQYIRTHAYL